MIVMREIAGHGTHLAGVHALESGRRSQPASLCNRDFRMGVIPTADIECPDHQRIKLLLGQLDVDLLLDWNNGLALAGQIHLRFGLRIACRPGAQGAEADYGMFASVPSGNPVKTSRNGFSGWAILVFGPTIVSRGFNVQVSETL